MSTRSTTKEHTRRIHEIRYLIQTGCSKQVSELIMQATLDKEEVSEKLSKESQFKEEQLNSAEIE